MQEFFWSLCSLIYYTFCGWACTVVGLLTGAAFVYYDLNTKFKNTAEQKIAVSLGPFKLNLINPLAVIKSPVVGNGISFDLYKMSLSAVSCMFLCFTNLICGFVSGFCLGLFNGLLFTMLANVLMCGATLLYTNTVHHQVDKMQNQSMAVDQGTNTEPGTDQ
jgi:hypothetical protein